MFSHLSQALVLTMIGSQVGLGIIEALQHNWRSATIAMLAGIINLLIFWK